MTLQRLDPELESETAASALIKDRPSESVLVTVVISVYDGRPFLRRAVDSILAQTHSNLELIVVDDGSTDGGLDVLSEVTDPRLIRLHQEHAGKSVAMNYALRVARGEFYAVQDADDFSDPDRIRIQLQFLLDNPDVGVVLCGHRLLLKGRQCAPRMRQRGREACWRKIRAMQMPALDPTAMYRISAVRDVEYEPTLTTAQGYDYLLQITEKHPAVVLEDCLYTYRIHAGSRTRSDIAGRLRFVQMVQLRAAVRRRVSLPPIMRLLREPSPNSNSERDNNLPAHFIESVLDQRRLGRRFAAFRTGLVCAGVHPFDPSYYKALAYSIVPLALLNCLRSESGLSELTRTPEPVGEKPPLMAQVGAYDSWERDDILALVPVEAKRVLSCGCGSGLTEETLVRRGANVLGIEVDPAAAGVARLRGLRILAQNLEGNSAALPDESFDCMIYADVLEHLRDPETVLRAQRAHLMPGGAIVVSVPNFRNFSVLWQLFVRGHVHHTDSGILDRTHMKLTTRRLVESWLGMLDMNVDDVRYKMNRRRDRVLSLLTLGVFDEWLATQILVVARDTRANDIGRLEPAPPIRESHASARVDLPA